VSLSCSSYTILKENLLHKDMKVLAIDIGYHNMGLVVAECGNGPNIDVKYIKKGKFGRL